MDVAVIVLVAVAGLVIGSLANRLVVREPGYVITDPGDLPEGADESLLDELEEVPDDLPPVPLLAVLRPRASWRPWFPLVEVAMALCLVAVAVVDLRAWVQAALAVLVVCLVTLSAVDFRVFRLPDRINFPSMALGFASIVIASIALGSPGAVVGAIGGGVLYAGLLFVAHIVSPRGMGWGDVKLAWLMGFYLGWFGWTDRSTADLVVGVVREVLRGAAFGSMVGVVTGLGYALARRSAKSVFPFGPSLAAGCLIALLTA